MMFARDNTGRRILMATIAVAIFLIMYSVSAMASSTGTTVHYIIGSSQYGANITSTPDQTVNNNSNSTYTVTITNNGTLTDSYVLTLDNLDNASIAQLNQTVITNLSSGQSFNITLNLGDNDPGNYTVTITATSQGDNAVSDSLNITTEVIPGLRIINTTISPYAAINGSNVTLYIDAENFQSVWAVITRPDNSTENVTLNDEANTVYLNTSLIGRYDIVFYANNSIGEVRNVSDYFETFTGFTIDLDVIDSNVSGVNSTFVSYYRNGSLAINSSSVGKYIVELANTFLDLEFYAYDDRLIVRTDNINISYAHNKYIGMDKHFNTTGYLVTYGVEPEWNVSDASIRIRYDDLNYSVEDNLRLYKCDNYNFTGQVCLGTWNDVTSLATQNQASDYFQISVTSFSGFAVKEETSTPPVVCVGCGGGGGGGGDDPTPTCYEDWTCGPWEECFNGQQSRLCVDRNSCGTDEYRPVSRIACFIPCDSQWECGDWNPCGENGVQTRECVDAASCGTRRGMPSTEQHCAYDSCSDGRQNLDEEGLDCGGHCPPCAELEQPRIVEWAEANILCMLIPLLAVILLVLIIMGRGSNMPPKRTRMFAIVNFVLMVLALLTLLPTIRCPAGICMAVADTMPIIDEILLFFIVAFTIALSEGLLYIWFERKAQGVAEKKRSHGWLLMVMLLGTAVMILTALSAILTLDSYHILAYLSPVLISSLILTFVLLTRKEEKRPPRPPSDIHVRITEKIKILEGDIGKTIEKSADALEHSEEALEKRLKKGWKTGWKEIVTHEHQTEISLNKVWRKISQECHDAKISISAYIAKQASKMARARKERKRKYAIAQQKKEEEKRRKKAEETRKKELLRKAEEERLRARPPKVHYQNPTFSVNIDKTPSQVAIEEEKKALEEIERQDRIEKDRKKKEEEKKRLAKKKDKLKLAKKGPSIITRVIKNLSRKKNTEHIKELHVFDTELEQTKKNISWLKEEKRRLQKKLSGKRDEERKRKLAETEVYLDIMEKKLRRLERVRRRMI